MVGTKYLWMLDTLLIKDKWILPNDLQLLEATEKVLRLLPKHKGYLCILFWVQLWKVLQVLSSHLFIPPLKTSHLVAYMWLFTIYGIKSPVSGSVSRDQACWGWWPLPCPCLCLLLMTICTMVPDACWESIRAPRWLLPPGKRGGPPACLLGGGS